MANYRTIKSSFWNDPWVENLEKDEKLLYVYLFTNIYVNNAGVMKITLDRIVFETGINLTYLNKTLNRFSAENKVYLIDDYIWVVKFIKHQTSTSPMILKNIAKCLENVQSNALIDTILETYNTLSIPYAHSIEDVKYPLDTNEVEDKEEVKEETKIKKKVKLDANASLITIFGNEYKKTFDVEYHASFGKDGNLLKKLADHYGKNEVATGIKYFFDVYIKKEKFAGKNPDVGKFYSQWNGIVAMANKTSRSQREMQEFIDEN